MRITGGVARGRPIRTPRGTATRPLLSRVRKSLFDVIGDRIQRSHFLDLYSGSGAVGIEALSRGAEVTVFVEKDTVSVETIKENLASCNFSFLSKIWQKDVLTFLPFLLEKERFDFIFIAPPYYQGLQDRTLDIIERKNIGRSWIVVQHSRREKVNLNRKNIKMFKQKRYGDTILSFLDGSHA
ncbi:MAG: 16S rRNA (guanine(966)-N(2))-methyltransferase RsmD [bacterium]